MNDHIKPEIAMYLAGQLTESRNRQIEAHAAGCDKCRSALSKARTKLARVKREALKKADPEKIPNFFLARHGKEGLGGFSPHRRGPLIVILLLLAGAGYWGYGKWRAVPVHVSVDTEDVQPPASKPESGQAKPVTPVKPITPVTPVIPAQVPDTPKVPLTLAVIQSFTGADCEISEGRLVVIRRLDAWRSLWTEMQSIIPVPDVNFNDHIVLGVFAGLQPAGTTITMGKIVEKDEEMIAPYQLKTPAVDASTATAASVPATMTRPYLFVVVPRVERKIKLARRDALP